MLMRLYRLSHWLYKLEANAVVLKDVPSGAVAVGIPARLIRRGGGSELELALDS